MSDEKQTRMNMNDLTRKITRGNKIAGIITGILMVVLGILFFAMPIRTGYVVAIIATVGFIFYGLYQIVGYVRTPSEVRNGWNLANGIIFMLVGVMILLSSVTGVIITFAFLLGFLALSGGINQISAYGVFKKEGEPGCGWMLASGIINIILGVFLIMTPFAATLVVDYVLGIYLIVGGIALFAEAASGKAGRKA
jgi:uncharacterized membrane protein HdeD (DUF308 family)